jgi:hypothetical protein
LQRKGHPKVAFALRKFRSRGLRAFVGRTDLALVRCPASARLVEITFIIVAGAACRLAAALVLLTLATALASAALAAAALAAAALAATTLTAAALAATTLTAAALAATTLAAAALAAAALAAATLAHTATLIPCAVDVFHKCSL